MLYQLCLQQNALYTLSSKSDDIYSDDYLDCNYAHQDLMLKWAEDKVHLQATAMDDSGLIIPGGTFRIRVKLSAVIITIRDRSRYPPTPPRRPTGHPPGPPFDCDGVFLSGPKHPEGGGVMDWLFSTRSLGLG